MLSRISPTDSADDAASTQGKSRDGRRAKHAKVSEAKKVRDKQRLAKQQREQELKASSESYLDAHRIGHYSL